MRADNNETQSTAPRRGGDGRSTGLRHWRWHCDGTSPMVDNMRAVRNPVVRDMIRNPKRVAGSHVQRRELARLREIKREIEESLRGKPRYY